jgi:D-sedoheptulose 7-phosphate isomerase
MVSPNTYIDNFLAESLTIIDNLDRQSIEAVVEILVEVKKEAGRIFFIGSGGGAGHSSHAACDFRKLAQIESYCVTDNVSELTARINDESWEEAYANYLAGSHLGPDDCVFVFSVGGGDEEKGVSLNLVQAMKFARSAGASIVGIAGRQGGYLAQAADACIIIPPVIPANVTTQVEGFQALLWHLIVCHPSLESKTPKWESIS